MAHGRDLECHSACLILSSMYISRVREQHRRWEMKYQARNEKLVESSTSVFRKLD